MPQTIVFDTNYYKSFGPREYLANRLPKEMADQIDLAFRRGDLVALLDTVRTETNAWLADSLRKEHEDLDRALRALTDAGFTVTPATVDRKNPPDIFLLMQASNPNVPILAPTIEDYREAERRTSHRLPPLPKKRDGEEMRDRVIWCQLLRYSAGGHNPVLIVSGDEIFLNGANSEEGNRSRIRRVEGKTDLDQHLGERPPHIQEVVNKLLHFAKELGKRGITLTAGNIRGIDALRKVRQSDGSIEQRFSLITSPDSGLPNPSSVTLAVIGDEPVAIAINGGETISVAIATVETDKMTMMRLQKKREQELAAQELRRLVGGA